MLKHLRRVVAPTVACGVALLLHLGSPARAEEGARPSEKTVTKTSPLDCEYKACKSRKDMLHRAFLGASAASQTNPAAPSTSSTSVSGNEGEPACPADKEALGAATWTLLHTLAAHFPDTPTPYEELQTLLFFQTLARFYPCPVCRHDLQLHVAATPPDTTSRERLSLWVCGLHNAVNEKLGKPRLPCRLADLDRRWLESDSPDCD